MLNSSTDQYADIINLPHHQSNTRPHMPLRDRAAQFSPFAALTGHDAAIAETARLTDKRIQLSEDKIAALNDKLQMIKELLPERPEVRLTYFVPDEKKDGGAYITKVGHIKGIDQLNGVITFIDQTTVPFDSILDIESTLFLNKDSQV